MKKSVRSFLSLTLVLIMAFFAVSCADKAEASLWDDAVYTSDTELGEGEKVLSIEVSAQDKTVVFTVKTDKETVGEALLENGIIEGEQGPYGLYIKKVNGIRAAYDLDKAYWAFYVDGDYAVSGVDATPIDQEVVYGLTYTK